MMQYSLKSRTLIGPAFFIALTLKQECHLFLLVPQVEEEVVSKDQDKYCGEGGKSPQYNIKDAIVKCHFPPSYRVQTNNKRYKQVRVPITQYAYSLLCESIECLPISMVRRKSKASNKNSNENSGAVSNINNINTASCINNPFRQCVVKYI